VTCSTSSECFNDDKRQKSEHQKIKKKMSCGGESRKRLKALCMDHMEPYGLCMGWAVRSTFMKERKKKVKKYTRVGCVCVCGGGGVGVGWKSLGGGTSLQ